MIEADECSFDNQPAVQISFEERREQPNWALIAISMQKSQAIILEKLEASSKECQAAKETSTALKKQLKTARYHCENVIAAAAVNNPVFECASCGKVFLSGDFLLSHIDRHHRSMANGQHGSDEGNSDFVEGSDRVLSKVLLAISDLRHELVQREQSSSAPPFIAKHSPVLTLNSAVAERLERLEFATDRILTEVVTGNRPSSSAAAPIGLSRQIAPSPSPIPAETESGSMLLTAERYPDQKLSESQTNIYESISPDIGGQLNQSMGSADTSIWGSSMGSAHGLRERNGMT
uniref:C2H2-type domain-containing protein n=1 Tax=Plectus sambesii TaxID=2011161 RepID=A0A914UY72_9BILA